jgi:hypothetical protein
MDMIISAIVEFFSFLIELTFFLCKAIGYRLTILLIIFICMYASQFDIKWILGFSITSLCLYSPNLYKLFKKSKENL